nr:glycerophosphodiester phosphodiesterase [Virgibacillus sp. YIM 98842]
MKTKIIAHRGASKYAPENTMPAFELAYKIGADGIETDVQLTKDHVPVLIHDENVNRTTDGAGYIKDYTYHELKNLDAGAWFSKKFQGARILSLDKFLKWVENKPLYLNIELKNNKIDYRHLESIVYERIVHYQLLNRTTISTFNPNSIKRMKRYNDKLEIAFLASKSFRNLIDTVTELGGNAIHVKYSLLHKKLAAEGKQKNIPLRVFTVNRKMRIVRCLHYKVEGIFTDVPDKALAIQKYIH